MKKFQFKIIFICWLLLNSILLFGQELPPIIKYNSTVYNAGNQNWMISQDKNHFIYFANNEGLLEFNGSNWTLYKSPNETIVRSVNVIDNKIFTGCYMEFGYWVRKTNGKLIYTSLSKSIKNKILDDEQFWNILNYEQCVIFQSLDRIYIYDTKTRKFKIIIPPNKILKSFKTSNSIYYQTVNFDLFEIENGTSKLVSNNSILKNNKIVNVFATEDGLLIHTQFNGFYKLSDGNLVKFNTEADSEIAATSAYSSQILKDNSFAVGTISNGVFILTKNGKVKYHITQNKGLSNNTALSILEDSDRNLWIGLDNGINCINLQSPIRSFFDDTGILGTVYASILHKGKLYIGTNQGLFYKDYLNDSYFKFINGTKGQVWSLFVYDGTLFCGHDSGTYVIDNNTAKLIFSQSGTWKFVVLPNKNIILQGNYYGISVLEKVNNQWTFRNKISGFNYSSKYFEITNSNEVYVSHEYKSIFRFQLDSDLRKGTKLYTYTNPIKGKNAGLAKFNNSIYYAYKDGIFKLNQKTKQFEKDILLSSVFDKGEYISGKLILDNSNKLWVFSKSHINYFTVNKLSSDYKRNIISIPSSITNLMLGYENITQLSNSQYLIGTTDGYYTFNINELNFKNYSVVISDISINKLNDKITSFSMSEPGKFAYDQNNVAFSYTVPEYNKYIIAEYQYLLDGFQDEWSEWSSKSSVNFKNLPPGNYTFKVRSKVVNSQPEDLTVYSFTITKPWYLTNLALIIYFILTCILAYYINKTYESYYFKQKQKLIEENNLLLEIKELENEQQLMKLRNEQLSIDVNEKSRELALSTMSLIKKDELLSLIKEDLKKSSDETSSRSIKSVITSTINKNISVDNAWNAFKEAFDTADKDFLKKVKQEHASLTPNDLRLCAYLRLNLSSKEIAPLLNISVRSVEIKRYRLRKKMDLPHKTGLVEYILSI